MKEITKETKSSEVARAFLETYNEHYTQCKKIADQYLEQERYKRKQKNISQELGDHRLVEVDISLEQRNRIEKKLAFAKKFVKKFSVKGGAMNRMSIIDYLGTNYCKDVIVDLRNYQSRYYEKCDDYNSDFLVNHNKRAVGFYDLSSNSSGLKGWGFTVDRDDEMWIIIKDVVEKQERILRKYYLVDLDTILQFIPLILIEQKIDSWIQLLICDTEARIDVEINQCDKIIEQEKNKLIKFQRSKKYLKKFKK